MLSKTLTLLVGGLTFSFLQQSSTDIWHAVCSAVKIACQTADVASMDICGIGFAATCSLGLFLKLHSIVFFIFLIPALIYYDFLHAVAIGADDSPVTVSLTGDARRNIIVWMDHRAVDQTERINALHSPVLQFVGGAVSPEMQPPKV